MKVALFLLLFLSSVISASTALCSDTKSGRDDKVLFTGRLIRSELLTNPGELFGDFASHNLGNNPKYLKLTFLVDTIHHGSHAEIINVYLFDYDLIEYYVGRYYGIGVKNKHCIITEDGKLFTIRDKLIYYKCDLFFETTDMSDKEVFQIFEQHFVF